MRLIIDISHPAHFHFFKNAIRAWRDRGDDLLIVSRDKDITQELLDSQGIEHECLSKHIPGVIGLARELFVHEYKLYRLIKRFRPDGLLQIGGTFIVHVGKLTGIPSFVFYDTENAIVSNTITYPFADVICTPASYKGNIGAKQVRYNGYQEMAYLHPNWFTPDKGILKLAGLNEGEPYSVVRFVGWTSGHDVNLRGFSPLGKEKLIEALLQKGKVFISSEESMPKSYSQYSYELPKSSIHDLLAFSSLYIGESATMASESALLGIPSIFVSPVGRGYTDDLEKNYGLVYNYLNSDEDLAIAKAIELLSNPNLEKEWAQKRKVMLSEKIDVTSWIIDFIDQYLKSN